MSSGCRRARSVLVSSILSIRIRGLVLAPNVVIPRTKKSALSWPGSPLRWYAITPATLPASAVVRLLEGTFKVATSIVEMEPMTLSFFCLPKATMVVPSSSLALSFSFTIMFFLSPTAITCVSFPTNSILSLSVGLTPLISKEPSRSVITPRVVPSIETVAAGSG